MSSFNYSNVSEIVGASETMGAASSGILKDIRSWIGHLDNIIKLPKGLKFSEITKELARVDTYKRRTESTKMGDRYRISLNDKIKTAYYHLGILWAARISVNLADYEEALASNDPNIMYNALVSLGTLKAALWRKMPKRFLTHKHIGTIEDRINNLIIAFQTALEPYIAELEAKEKAAKNIGGMMAVGAAALGIYMIAK